MRASTRLRSIAITAVLALFIAGPASAERIKDLAQVAGVRGNALVGYGLVVGLDGSGDRTSQTQFTVQSLKTMLDQLGVTLPPGVNPQLKNVAAVAIHAELPPYAKPGQSIDVTVSSIGNAGSLRGGSLLMAPLKGADGQVYAIAQGSLMVSGFGASGRDGSRISVNAPNGGRIPNGATVERAVAGGASASDTITLNLHEFDFTTASRIVTAVNNAFGPGRARAVDGVTIEIAAPGNDRIGFLAQLEALDISPGASAAKVIVNARTGTVVMGGHVSVLPAAVSHGSLTVSIMESAQISQPAPFGNGVTAGVAQSTIEISEEGNRMFLLEGKSLQAIVNAVNAVGAAPGDIVAILEALKRVGALRAELEVI